MLIKIKIKNAKLQNRMNRSIWQINYPKLFWKNKLKKLSIDYQILMYRLNH